MSTLLRTGPGQVWSNCISSDDRSLVAEDDENGGMGFSKYRDQEQARMRHCKKGSLLLSNLPCCVYLLPLKRFDMAS